MDRLFVTGISYKTAPVALRELFAVVPSDHAAVGEMLQREGGLDEVVLLWTCNRVEIYGVAPASHEPRDELFRSLASKPAQLETELYHHSGLDAVRHLFRVTSGIDSMVLGETEITGQVRMAYERALKAGLTARVLNRTFQKAQETAKEVRTLTGIGRGATSVGSVTVQLAQQVFGAAISSARVMIIGAGKMAEACLKHLSKNGVASITVVNRSVDRARELAQQFGGEAVSFMNCFETMVESDLVITSTGCPHMIIHRSDMEGLMARRGGRRLVMIDIAVPRDVDPEVKSLPGIHLYDIDDLEGTVRENVLHRRQDLALCHEIIDAKAAELAERMKGMAAAS